MKIEDINNQSIEEALEREKEAISKCGHRPGRFQTMAKEQGAITAAIKLINKKEPSEGLKKLYLCENKIKDAHKLSIEQIFVEFVDRYQNQFSDLFPNEVVELAKAKLPKQ